MLTVERRTARSELRKRSRLLVQDAVEFVDGQLVKEVFEECLRPAAHITTWLLLQHVSPEWQQRELWRSRVLGDTAVAGGETGESADVSPHTLRHSVTYRIIQVDGGRLEDVQLRLRHANTSMPPTARRHTRPRNARKALA